MIFRSMSNSAASIATRSTAASGSQVYESVRAVNEYLHFHYGIIDSVTSDIPLSNFPTRCAEICGKWSALHKISSSNKRALDLGCAVGGASFELSKFFDGVVGIDFSEKFVEAANNMKVKGQMPYDILKQGVIFEKHLAALSSDTIPDRVTFQQGDACNLSPSLGTFDVILGSNLLCRLPSPRRFLNTIPNFLSPQGLLVLISPYSWLEEYTPKSEWIGGYVDENGVQLDSFNELKKAIGGNLELVHRENVSFFIREHERKFQFGVSDCTIWKKPL